MGDKSWVAVLASHSAAYGARDPTRVRQGATSLSRQEKRIAKECEHRKKFDNDCWKASSFLRFRASGVRHRMSNDRTPRGFQSLVFEVEPLSLPAGGRAFRRECDNEAVAKYWVIPAR